MNGCCITWKERSKELKTKDLAELAKKQKEFKLPKSVFAASYELLENIGNFCPACGDSISSKKPKKVKESSLAESSSNPPKVSISTIPCPVCKGTKLNPDLGCDCDRCLGKGVIKVRKEAKIKEV